ncbi:MAG: sulfite exporter TauE/SafE family protein [Cyanobacteria bacterium J06627_15]
MLDFSDIALFGVLGITAGTLAGMLGIGGGMVIVPGLFYLFSVMGLPEESLMHMAAGTAMCIMLFTSTASTWSHHAKGDVQWSLFKQVVPAIGVGVILGNSLSNRLDTHWLEIVFGLFLMVVAVKILLAWLPSFGGTETPRHSTTTLIGSLIGFKSGILGIGGGAISVPFLLYCGLPMKAASGTSAAFTFPIAVVGTLAFTLFSPTYPQIEWSTGYLYWPAIALVAPFTMLGAPIGTLLSHRIPAERLRRIFALLLVFIGVRMLSGSLRYLV